jgi:iron(III) transport system substrate-binding protein
MPAYLRNRAKGAPIAATSLGPFANGSRDSYVVKGAPHPNAALLLMGWLQSPQGREIWERNYYGMASPCTAGPLAQALCEANIQVVSLETPEKSVQDTEYGKRAAQVIGTAAQ